MSDSSVPQDCPNLIHEAATVQWKVMFTIALVFLLLTAFSLHYYDHTPVTPEHDPEHDKVLVWLFAMLWFVIFIESIIGYWRTADYSWPASWRLLLIWLIPPYRLALATHPTGKCIWLPLLGWQKTDRHLFDRLDRGFSIPMLFIAMLIIPILGIELIGAKYIPLYPSLGFLLDFGTSIIWLAFSFEFILMSSVAEAKFGYIAKNWINIAIILLPLIAFLRGFQAVRLLRVGKATKILKTYRLRGLGMRAWRGVVTLELIELLLYRKPESRLERLKTKLHNKEQDLETLRQRISILEAEILAKEKENQTEQP